MQPNNVTLKKFKDILRKVAELEDLNQQHEPFNSGWQV